MGKDVQTINCELDRSAANSRAAKRFNVCMQYFQADFKNISAKVEGDPSISSYSTPLGISLIISL